MSLTQSGDGQHRASPGPQVNSGQRQHVRVHGAKDQTRTHAEQISAGSDISTTTDAHGNPLHKGDKR